MPKEFNGFGISILYPDSWVLEQEDENNAVTIESPEGAFLSVTQIDSPHDAVAIQDKAVAAMRGEYDEVERETTAKRIGQFVLEGIILRFVYLDLIVTSQILNLSHNTHTYLIQFQAEDRDHDRLQPVFEAMLTSMCHSLTKS